MNKLLFKQRSQCIPWGFYVNVNFNSKSLLDPLVLGFQASESQL